MSERYKYDLNTDFLRLRGDCTTEALALGDQFWPQLMSGKLGDFHHEYLVATSAFDRDWSNWECHPNGDEIVLLLAGRATFVLETSAGERREELAGVGEYVRVPATRGTRRRRRRRPPCSSSRRARARFTAR